MRASHHTRLRTAEAMHLAACCAASCRASSLGLLRDGERDGEDIARRTLRPSSAS